MSTLSEMITNDAKAIEESKRRDMDIKSKKKDLEILGEKRIAEIRAEFLPLVGKKGYHFSLKSSLKWIDSQKNDYLKYRSNFKARFIKNNPYFREAESEEDLDGMYIERASGKGREIYLSADGFKQFCSSEKTEKANAVRVYFGRIEREFVDAIHATPEQNRIKLGEYDQLVANHQKQIAEFFVGKNNPTEEEAMIARMDTDLSKSIKFLLEKIKKSEDERAAFEIQANEAQFDLRQNEILTLDLKRQCLPDGSEDSYRKIVNAKLREKEFPYVIEIYKISPATANKWIRAKRLSKKKKNLDEHKSIIGSDSESDPESTSTENDKNRYAGWGLSSKLVSILKDDDLSDNCASANDLSDEEFSDSGHCSQLGYYAIQSFGKGAASLCAKDQKNIDDWMKNEANCLNKKKKKPTIDFMRCSEFIRVNNKSHHSLILDNIGIVRTTKGKVKIYHTTINDILRIVDMTYIDTLKPPKLIEAEVSSELTSNATAQVAKVAIKPVLVGSAYLADRRATRELRNAI
jgi:hypothetical protein